MLIWLGIPWRFITMKTGDVSIGSTWERLAYKHQSIRKESWTRLLKEPSIYSSHLGAWAFNRLWPYQSSYVNNQISQWSAYMCHNEINCLRSLNSSEKKNTSRWWKKMGLQLSLKIWLLEDNLKFMNCELIPLSSISTLKLDNGETTKNAFEV